MRCRFVSEFGVLQSNHEHMLNSPIPRGFWESRICIDIPQNEKRCWNRDSKIHSQIVSRDEASRHNSLPQQSCGIIRSQLNMSRIPISQVSGVRLIGSMEQKKQHCPRSPTTNTPFLLKKFVGQKLPIPLGVIHQRGLWLLEACVAFEESEPMILCKELVAKEAIRVMRKKTY